MNEVQQRMFWSKVNKDGPTAAHMDTPCWVWTGSKSQGYGNHAVGLMTMRAHRVSLMLDGVDLGEAMVCHRCDNRACVRPDHLYAGTALDNARDTNERYPVDGRPRGRPTKGPDARAVRVSVLLTPAEHERAKAGATLAGCVNAAGEPMLSAWFAKVTGVRAL